MVHSFHGISSSVFRVGLGFAAILGGYLLCMLAAGAPVSAMALAPLAGFGIFLLGHLWILVSCRLMFRSRHAVLALGVRA